MKYKEFKKVERKEYVTTSCTCDFCGKVHTGSVPDDWVEIFPHYPWESCDDYLACSAECYIGCLSKIINDEDVEGISGISLELARGLVELYTKE